MVADRDARGSGRRRVRAGAIAKRPRSVGDRASGIISESHRQRLQTIGRRPTKAGRRRKGAYSAQHIGAVAAIAEEVHRVAKAGRIGRTERNRHQPGLARTKGPRDQGTKGPWSIGPLVP